MARDVVKVTMGVLKVVMDNLGGAMGVPME